MYHIFEVSKNLKDISKKIGIDAEGTIKKIIYDRKRESVSFVIQDFRGDARSFKRTLEDFIGVHIDLVFETENGNHMESLETLHNRIMQLLNGSGKYIEKIEIEGEHLRIYALGEFGKAHVLTRLKKIERTLPFKKYTVDVVEPTNDTTPEDFLLNGASQASQNSVQLPQEKPSRELGKDSKDGDKHSISEGFSPSVLKTLYTPSEPPAVKKKAKLYGKIFKIDKVSDEILNVYITDKRDSILGKVFNSKVKELEESLAESNWYIFTGSMNYDKNGNLFFKIDSATSIPSLDRMDNAVEKRIELHAHTKMSDLDSVLDIAEYVKTAKKWGWNTIAVTDHGNVQSIPELYELAKSEGLKPIFGCELYIANDPKKIMVNEIDGSIESATYVVLDLETTGLNPRLDEIMEIGAVKIFDGRVADEFHTLVKPTSLKEKSLQITGITEDMLKDAPEIADVIDKLWGFLKGAVLVAHNADFDIGFLKHTFARFGREFNPPYIDTLRLSQALLRNQMKAFSLDKLVEHFKLGKFQHHRALDDARVTARVFLQLVELLKKKSITTFDRINKLVEHINPLSKHPQHLTVLVQNKTGLKNLYKLISKSHTETFFTVPQVLRSDLEKHREGLLIGTGCANSEIFEAALEGDKDALNEMLKFYDYVEIMPLDTIISEEFTKDEAKRAYRLLYEVAKELNIPVVMVSNAHFLDPEDIKARKVLLAPQSNVEDVDANYYLRTTEEMLQAAMEIFEDEKVSREIVIENPRKIAQMVEEIKPLEKKLHPPKIEGAEEKLREMTLMRAYELYGNPLPEIVEKRIEKELNSIIGHGYAVLYMIAHLIVKKAGEDGYVVGSRGSVGSSLVAHLVGITEVNPLPAHYRCPDCKYFELHEEYGSGYDLPDKRCPKCGAKLEKAGQDIPFEVFMGFEGDKVPDIDLNFSGEYQERAHKFIEELFGKSHVFRAGTISTIADRSAVGYVKSYMEDKNGNIVNPLNPAEQERLAMYVTGVKRTTGQHPGGLMIVPSDYDIHDFTPYQHPANDKKSGVYTTHFAYEAIHDDLVKLDALGHDDPTMIKLLYEYSGVDPMSIPMDDRATMSIFSSVRALGVDPQELGTDIGTIGIPEFGTDFVMGMLRETRPKTFAELVRISGLSHGTDVWLGNAQTLIEKKIATLSEVISCRDDIMIYLIHKGVPPSNAFKIMENVRKGKGLKEEEEKLMKEHKVPEWFIESCKKIKYLFPKAHAVAYVSMAFRIAYFKVHYPLAFYAAFFSTKGDEFDAELILKGKEAIKRRLMELNNNPKKDVKEKNEEKVLEAALEMLLRGFGFKKPDLKKSHHSRFIIDGKDLLIPFNKIHGIGDNVAKSIVQQREIKMFTSVEDLMSRAKVTKAQVEVLKRLGVLDGLPETDQASLF
ncbi:DNA polymerase-3 subunit alpha [Fervidobacterium changbaicum]|uniref:DNA polymerase III PolC-type n=1 Tax=Fervidobacterium changbaicum TaxID=310769 RepID=A0ABX5QSN0_9BACT|nr:PolC-type DNA polymerase III [Fervidobacterium changbaicum]QAV33512.1 PolC-type DNA polymerase III [Fervidobacterium changbaicum]SDH62450.1 DNA polymerase-3 subunit alpha [Fervidobacterium changbaicum]